MIKVENLSYSYNRDEDGEVPILKDFNLEIREAEFVGLIGPNGSGKTTLAKCLNATLIPTSGRVLVDGMDTTLSEARWDVHRRVSVVFTNPENQLIGATVEEDVAFGLENIGMESSLMRDRVDEVLKILQMEWAKDLPIYLLSPGQKQRVIIAAVLALQPKYLILDNATAFLDPRGRREILKILQRLNREEGMAILLITHSLEEVFLTDRVVVMDGGRNILEGPPKEIFRNPKVKELGLTPPLSFRFIECLRSRGLDVPEEAKEVEEVVEAICP